MIMGNNERRLELAAMRADGQRYADERHKELPEHSRKLDPATSIKTTIEQRVGLDTFSSQAIRKTVDAFIANTAGLGKSISVPQIGLDQRGHAVEVLVRAEVDDVPNPKSGPPLVSYGTVRAVTTHAPAVLPGDGDKIEVELGDHQLVVGRLKLDFHLLASGQMKSLLGKRLRICIERMPDMSEQEFIDICLCEAEHQGVR